MIAVGTAARNAASTRRHALLVGVAVAVLAALGLAVPGVAHARISGYGVVGADPATDLGFSRQVVAASVVTTDGGSVSGTVAGTQVRVDVPADYYARALLVSVVDLNDEQAAAALLPTSALQSRSLRLGVGVGLRPVDLDEATTAAGGRAAAVGTPPGSVTIRLRSGALVGGTVHLVTGGSVSELTPSGEELVVTTSGPAAVFVVGPATASPVATVPPAPPTTASPTTASPSAAPSTSPAATAAPTSPATTAATPVGTRPTPSRTTAAAVAARSTPSASGLAFTGTSVLSVLAVAIVLLAVGLAGVRAARAPSR